MSLSSFSFITAVCGKRRRFRYILNTGYDNVGHQQWRRASLYTQ